MWTHESGYVLDPAHARLDLDRVTAWLTQTYWARGRSFDEVKRSVDNSAGYGLYAPDSEQVGFFRVVTDRTTFAWLCDVFIDPAHRGKGLSLWALEHVRDDVLRTGVYRILLATSDAHGIYEKLGFTPHPEPEKWMELTTRKIGRS
jgi:GNAT superfamily N-acetyltransferase